MNIFLQHTMKFLDSYLIGNSGQVGIPGETNATNLLGGIYAAGYATLGGIFEDPHGTRGDEMRYLHLLHRVGVCGSILAENTTEPRLITDGMIAAHLFYKGSCSLLIGISEFYKEDYEQNAPLAYLSSMHGIYTISLGILRIANWWPVNPSSYVETHSTVKRLVQNTRDNTGNPLFANVNELIQHPNFEREINDHCVNSGSCSKRIIDVALEKIELSMNDPAYVAGFEPIQPQTEYVVFAKATRAADHNLTFVMGETKIADKEEIAMSGGVTRTDSEICELLESVRHRSGRLINSLVIEGHGTEKQGMQLSVNSELDKSNLTNLVNSINKNMKPGAPIILDGCSNATLAAQIAAESGHPVYGTVRNIQPRLDHMVLYKDQNGFLAYKGTGDNIRDSIKSTEVVKLF
jgi:hypothetical protein